jgi:hypothetical protein
MYKLYMDPVNRQREAKKLEIGGVVDFDFDFVRHKNIKTVSKRHGNETTFSFHKTRT